MNFLRVKIFRRLFFMYSAIVIITLISLSIFITSNIKKTIREDKVYLNRKSIEAVSDYFKEQDESSDALINYLYNKPSELEDTIYFLTNSYDIYIRKRLDVYCSSDKNVYEGINSFSKSCFLYNANIKNVIFYSYKNKSFIVFDQNGIVESISNEVDKQKYAKGEEKINDSLIGTLQNTFSENDKDYYYTVHNINNPSSLSSIGKFIVKYKLEPLNNIVKSYDKAGNYVIAVNKEGWIIYDNPHINQLKVIDKINLPYKDYYTYISNTAGGVTITGLLPENNIFKESKFILLMSYSLTALLILIAEIITLFKINNLSKRVGKIMDAMKEIESGNFEARIVTNEGQVDEITLISNSFNKMCEKVEDYIRKVYLAEIKQKNADMRALQSQINPHFLYNTLESIRMKAISNGDKEVGKMLYNLSVLFRNMVKGKSLITVAQELEHCRLYLDLFKFRYEGRFDYSIEVDDELLYKEIIKFTLQPIVENYIVHGVMLEREDNFITIKVKKDIEDILISIEDNGRGIEEVKLGVINKSIEGLHKNHDSLGIINVHERIVLTYGREYGIKVMNRECGGIIVLIKIPNKGVELDV